MPELQTAPEPEDISKAPSHPLLSFVCPLKWDNLDKLSTVSSKDQNSISESSEHVKETRRFCNQCKCTVQDIGDLSAAARRNLQLRVAAGEKICVSIPEKKRPQIVKVASLLIAISFSITGCAGEKAFSNLATKLTSSIARNFSVTECISSATINAMERKRLDNIYQLSKDEQPRGPSVGWLSSITPLLGEDLQNLNEAIKAVPTSPSTAEMTAMVKQGVFHLETAQKLQQESLKLKNYRLADYCEEVSALAAMEREQPALIEYWRRQSRNPLSEQPPGLTHMIQRIFSAKKSNSFAHIVDDTEHLLKEQRLRRINRLSINPGYALLAALREGNKLPAAQRLRFADVNLRVLEIRDFPYGWALLTSIHDLLDGHYGSVMDGSEATRVKVQAYKKIWQRLALEELTKQLLFSDTATEPRDKFDHLQRAYRIWLLDPQLGSIYYWPSLAQRFINLLPQLESYNRDNCRVILSQQANSADFADNKSYGMKAIVELFRSEQLKHQDGSAGRQSP